MRRSLRLPGDLINLETLYRDFPYKMLAHTLIKLMIKPAFFDQARRPTVG